MAASRSATVKNWGGEAEKIEGLVSKRLVGEAYLRRQKKKNAPDTFEYVAGARATVCRNAENAEDFRRKILNVAG